LSHEGELVTTAGEFGVDEVLTEGDAGVAAGELMNSSTPSTFSFINDWMGDGNSRDAESSGVKGGAQAG